jgi:plasmid stabilization system protein ParE
MRIVWSPLAVQRLREAAEYIARDKPGAAERWVGGAFEAVGRFAELPIAEGWCRNLGGLISVK